MRNHVLLASAAMLTIMSTPAWADPLAGVKPATSQSGADAGCIGGVQLIGVPGASKVATGTRFSATWNIDNISTTPAVCSFPSAQPIEVRCMRAGLAVDPSYCQVSEYAALKSQGYQTVANSSNWATAQWVVPGQTDSGCTGQWQSVDGQKPMGCGAVQVPVSSTCRLTNLQSTIGPDDPSKYCPSPAPAATRSDTDYSACGYAIETGGWGAYSATCGSVTHVRSLTCRRADGTAMSMSNSNCTAPLATYCASHTCIGSGDSTQEQEAVQLPACAGQDPYGGEYVWTTGPWQSSGVTCGTDNQTRSVSCVDSHGITVDPSNCVQTAPAGTQSESVSSGCSSPAPTPTPAADPASCSTDIVGFQDLRANGSQSRFVFAYNAYGNVITTYGVQGNQPISALPTCQSLGYTVQTGTDADDVTSFDFNNENNIASSNANGAPSCFILHDARQNMTTGATLARDYDFSQEYYAKPSGAATVCSGSASSPAPTATPTPTPTPTSSVATEIQVGWCGYTSSGGGRYACGVYGNYRPGPAAPAGPGALCNGNVLAGDPNDPGTSAGQATQTPNVGPNWQVPPAARTVAGAQCVVHYRAFGYSDSSQEGWESVYYDGTPTGVAGGLFIGPKP